MPGVELRSAADDLAYLERLLSAADLPTDDVRDNPGCFSVAVAADGNERVGCGGIEAYGEVGLLRSVVVESERRGEGYGAALYAALEDRARADGIDSLYLLTTTAADFFDSQGYERVERSAAPASVQETTQFAELCPESAVCMRKEVDGSQPQ